MDYVKTTLLKIILATVLITAVLCSILHAEKEGGGQRVLSLCEYLLFPRIWLSVLIGIGGGVLLRFSKIRTFMRIALLVLIFIIFAVLPVFQGIDFFTKLSPHPSPMCALTKPVIFSLQMKHFIVPPVFAGILLLIAFLSIIGNKLFCGWVCPVGAVQEIFYLMLLKRTKVQLSFIYSNSIRLVLLFLFVPVLVSFGIFTYGFFNPFEILHWPFGTDFWSIYTWTVISVTIIVSVFIFRPFCHIICPIGVLTWLLEHISLAKIRLRKAKCNNCRVCINQSPCLAISSILAGTPIRSDCYACGKCISICPANALEFSVRRWSD